MSAIDIINDNYTVKNNSFLYYLLNKGLFNRETFRQLYDSVSEITEQDVAISEVALKLYTIHTKILEAFLYHFNASDPYKISNLPENYNKILQQLEKCILFYFKTRI